MCKMWNKNKSFYPKVRDAHINYVLSKYLWYIYLTITTIYIYTIANYFRYMIKIDVFDATDKTNFVIFDWDLAKKQTEVQLI